MATRAPTPRACALDVDCPGNSICFSAQRTKWVKDLYGRGGALCECSRARGFVGYPECSTRGGAFWGELVLHGFLYIILLCTAVLCIMDLFRLRKMGQLRLKYATTQTTLLVLVATIFHAVALSYTRLCSLPGANSDIAASGFKLCTYTTPLLLFTVLSALASFLAQSHVTIVWLNLANRLKLDRFKGAASKSIARVVYTVEAIYFAVLTLASVFLRLELALLATIFLALLLFIGFIWGGRTLASALQGNLLQSGASQEQNLTAISNNEAPPAIGVDNEVSQTGGVPEHENEGGSPTLQPSKYRLILLMGLRQVRNVTSIMAILLLVELVLLTCSTFYALQTGGIAYDKDEFYRPTAISLLLSLLFMIVMNAVVAWYINSSINNAIIASNIGREHINRNNHRIGLGPTSLTQPYTGSLTAHVASE